MDRTLFHAKKIIKRVDGGWHFNINLLFESREFALTDYPINIGDEDVRTLIPGTDPNSVEVGTILTDIIDIENEYQFEKIFHSVLTDDARELLTDVYSGRSWSAKIMDTTGNVIQVSAYLSEPFYDMFLSTITEAAPCWIELSFADTSFNEDWTLGFSEVHTVYSNMNNGMAPLNLGQAVMVMDMFNLVSRFSDHEEFRTTITKQGNSLVLKVTDQCRHMGLDVGDEVNVTLDNSNPRNNTRMRVFDSRKWIPIDNPDDICHRDGCNLDLVERFIKDFKIIGTVNAGMFMPAHPGSPYRTVLDHLSFLKTESGENIIVSQPYKKSFRMKDAEEWASIYGCSVEEYRDYSWHHPPETTLIVFRRIENPQWKLPAQK